MDLDFFVDVVVGGLADSPRDCGVGEGADVGSEVRRSPEKLSPLNSLNLEFTLPGKEEGRSVLRFDKFLLS